MQKGLRYDFFYGMLGAHLGHSHAANEVTMAEPQLLVHHKTDNVGVVVVEGLRAGSKMLGVVIEDNSDFQLTAKDDVPIGHKVALGDLAEGDTIVKYGQDIGRMVKSAKKGDHIHTHNLKTKRW